MKGLTPLWEEAEIAHQSDPSFRQGFGDYSISLINIDGWTCLRAYWTRVA